MWANVSWCSTGRLPAVALFEQRISDEQVQAARSKIESGEVSLRRAALEIGCAPSTLSVRIKQAKLAEAAALVRAGLSDGGRRLSQRADANRDLSSSSDAGDWDRLGPIEVLHGALQATKPNGLPDWPTRMSALRILAALRPEELEPEEADDESAATVVYDLPPGSAPVLHRAQPGAEAPAGQAARHAEALPEPGVYALLRGVRLTRLVDHALVEEGKPVHILHTIEDAAQVLRAFGGDPACLDALADDAVAEAEPQPDTD